MIWLYILCAFLGFFILFLLGGAIYAYIRTFSTPKKRRLLSEKKINNENVSKLVNELLSYPYEDVYVRSYDGTMLFGRYYHINDGAPVHIMLHGYRGFAEIDFCGGAYVARELGHNILLVDMRGHGKSSGCQTCFGIKERFDAVCLANYVYERFGNEVPIFLNGTSMGGNTVLMASELNLPKTVVGIIAEGSFSSPSAVINHTIKMHKIPKILFPYTTTVIASLLFCGFNLRASSPIKAVKVNTLPILLMHGTNDDVVPYEMATEIYNASASEHKTLCTFEGAGHVLCYVSNPELYKSSFTSFTNACLKGFEFENKIYK